MLLRAAEQKARRRRGLADALPDRRDPTRIRHACEIIAARVFAIGCGYQDGNDLDRLRPIRR